MTTTGWMCGADAEGPGMPTAELLLQATRRGPGDELAIALGRSRAAEAREARDQAAAARDPDQVASALVARGYVPGLSAELAQRYADTTAELAAEREKIERGRQRQERVSRMHAAGQISGFDIAGMDLDEGDPATVARLERRADSLRRQLGEAQAMMTAPQDRVDGVEAASRHAHRTFVEVTRQRVAEMQAGRPAARPFASGSRGGVAVRSEPVTCPDCIKCGFTAEQSFEVHHTDADGRPIAAGSEVSQSANGQEAGRYQPAPPAGVTWGQLSGWIERGWRP